MQPQSHFNQSHRVYFRTIGALTLTSIVVFAVLCVAYYQRLSSSIIRQQYAHLGVTIGKVAVKYDEFIRNDMDGISDENVRVGFFLQILSDTTDTVVWVTDDKAGLLYASEIPREVRGQLQNVVRSKRTDPIYRIPDPFAREMLISSINLSNSLATGFFTDTQYVWITAACPIPGRQEYMLLHEKIDVEREAFSLMANGLGIPVVISFSLSLLLFLLVTRSFVRPVRLLSEAATKVANGDLSTRITVPESDNESATRFFVADELSDMIRTVNHMIERLESQENDRRVFISSIAHDLRTPLTSIKGFVSAMQDGTILPENAPYYLDIVSKEVDRLQTLTQSMTEISTLGQMDGLHIEPFDVRETIFSTLNGMETLLKEKHLDVQLESDFVEKEPILVKGDGKAISRVIYNLVNNAIKFTPENGAICIAVRSAPKTNQIYISVEDSGPGIPKDKGDRIFESFYKLDTSRSHQGSGLGLYICREILQAHGQKIYSEQSQYLGGARFTFTLQAHREEGKT